jgi:hypothetical protein
MDWSSTTADWIEFFLQCRNRFMKDYQDSDRSIKIEDQTIEENFYSKRYLSFLNDRPIPDIQQRELTNYMQQPEDPFDPDAYLKANPDVAGAIASGVFVSATQHWRECGKAEGRRLCLDNGMIEKGE